MNYRFDDTSVYMATVADVAADLYHVLRRAGYQDATSADQAVRRMLADDVTRRRLRGYIDRVLGPGSFPSHTVERAVRRAVAKDIRRYLITRLWQDGAQPWTA